MFLQLGNAYLKKTNRKFTNNGYFQLLHIQYTDTIFHS